MGAIATSTIKTSIVLGMRLFVQAGTLFLVARMLGPELFGVFAGVSALAVLMGTFSTFGSHLVLLEEVSKDKKSRNHILAYAVPTTIISGFCLLFVYLFVCFVLFGNLKISFFVFFCIGLAEIVVLPIFMIQATEVLALEKTAQSQILMTLPLMFRLVSAFFVVVAAPTQPILLFAFLYISTAFFLLLIVNKLIRSNCLSIREWVIPNKGQLRHSSKYAVLALTAAGPTEVDKIVAVKILPLDISGLYSVASRIVGSSVLPVMALLLSAFPRLFRYNKTDPIKSMRLINWMVFSVFLYSVVAFFILWIIAPLLESVFGAKYKGMAEIISWLCFSVPGFSLRVALGNIFISIGKHWIKACSEIVEVFLVIIISLILYKDMSFYSFLFSLVASEILVSIGLFCVLVFCRRKYKSVNTF